MKSRPVSVNVTANGLAANRAQQTANQAQASANKYRTEWEEVNSENLAALSTAQSEFESNLAWAKSQIYEGQHQNDSAVASLQSDMESSWHSMSTVEDSLYNSTSTATSEADSRLESLRAQNSQSMADLHSAANSLHAAANSLHADADSMRSSLTAATSELGKDITSTRNSLDGVRNSLRTATSEVGNDLANTRNSLAAVDADLRNGITKAGNDLASAKTSLAATGNSLATATSELQRQTGQLSGSLSTADSMIMFNSNAITEVKRTAGEISTTVSNIRVGGRNLLTNTRTLSDVWNGTTETVDGFTVAKATNTRTDGGNYDIIAWNGLTNIKSNTDYVLTFYAKASKATGIYSFLYNIGPGDTVSTGYMDGSTRNTLTTDYQRYTVHFHTATMPAGRTVNCLPVRLIEKGVTVWVYGCQLEEGNTATQWQPNPADTDQAISKVSQTADAIKADLANTKGDVASVKATASSLQTQITDNKNNISTVKQTADSLTSTVGQMPAKWQQAINDKANAQVLTSGVDMNNLTTAGTYLVTDFSAKNTPIGAYFMAVVESTADKSRILQRVKKDDSSVAYERSNYNSGWTAWERAATGTDITQVKQTIDGITTRVSNTEGNVSGLQQTAKSIQTSVSDNAKNISNVQQTATALQSDLSNAKGDISSLQQTATGLQSTVQSQSGKISQLQQDADGLSATVGGAAIDIIPNLDQQFVMGYGVENTTWQDNNSYIRLPTTIKATEVLPQTAGFALDIPLQAGKTYMQSIVFETDATIKDNVQPQWTWFVGGVHAIQNATLAKLGDNTYRLIGSYTPTQEKANSGYLRVFDIWNFADFVDVTTGTYLKFRNPRIWCPDDNSLAQLKLTADGLMSKVADTQGNVSKLQLTASSLQTQITNNKNDVASVKVKADGIRTDLTNAKNDIASVKFKADSLTSSMTNANNQISTLQHRADSITTTLSQGGNNLLNNSQGNFQPKNSAIDNWARYGGVNVYMTQGRKYTVSAQSAPGFAFGSTHNTTTESNRILLWLVDNNVYQVISSNTTDISQGGTHFTWNHPSGIYTLRVNSYKKDNSGYAYHVQIECGDNATPWQPSNGDISSLQQTASQLTADMKDAKGNISSLQQTAGGLTSDVRDAKGNISSLQQKATELGGQIKAVDGRATTIKATADGISARVSKIEGNQTVGSLLKLTGNEAGLGSYVNGKLIAGINTNTNGNVTIDGKQIHLTHYTQIDDGCINASKITVHNSVGNDNGEAKDQYLAAAWGQLNSTIGKTTDNGKTSLWGSINQTAEKFSSYYTRADVDNKLSQQSSLISQTANNITALVNDAKNFTTFTVSSTNKWDFNNTKSAYGNWFLNGDTSSNYVYNGPSYTWGQKLAPYMYVTSRGPKDGSRFVVTVWKDNDPTQYQRVWNGSWSDWVMLPNSQNLISAINLSPDSVKISGKNIELNGNTKVTGRLDLMQDSARSVSQSTNYHNNWVWNNAHIYFDNYLQLLGENCNVHYTNTNTTLNGGKTFYSITTLTPGYLKFTTYNHKVNDTDENFDGQITRSYLDSGRLETPEVYTDKFVITGHHIRVRDNQFLMLTNKNGTNFDNNGSVGFQVWGGIVLGQNTIGAPSNELYFQRGNIDAILGQSYSDAPKLTLHAQKVVSQEANSVSSRLSVKTSITKVTYDRALMAVQNTDMYDYRYIADNSGQHYVSGIIDDVHDKPEYNMDPMLINQERTARIDANLLGYHHVVLQEILKRLDKLEAK